MTPPRLARALLQAWLPARHARVILADLDEEYERYIRPARTAIRAAIWYWAQVLRSIPAGWRLRRSEAVAARHHLSSGAVASALGRILHGLGTDTRFGLRLIRRRPGLAAAVIATLGVGIAVTTASVTLVHAVLLRPLPYASPGAVVSLAELDTRRDSSSGNMSWPDFLDYQARTKTLASLAGHTGGSRTLTGSGPADRLVLAEVTANFFQMLGVSLAQGRAFQPEDGADGAAPVAILTEETWRTRFGSDPRAVGRTIELSGQAVTIVGVLPRDFVFPPRGLAQIWMPLRLSQAQRQRRYYHWLDAVGRLQPGTSIEQARSELQTIARSFTVVDPEFHPASDIRVRPFADAVVGDVRPILLIVLGAAAMLLLIACTNIAGLLVARAAARRRELEVRSALGASRLRLVRQLVLETAVLGGPAILAGLATGHWLLVRLVDTIPYAQRVALPHLTDLTLHPVAVAVSLGVAVCATFAAGLAPAWTVLGGRHATAFRVGVGGSVSERRVQTILLAAQIAIAVVLLTGAGLMAQSVRRLAAISPGFDTDGLLTMRLTLAGGRYRSPEAVRAFQRDLLSRLSHIPGVAGAATIDDLPLTGRGNNGTFRVRSGGADAHATSLRSVSSNYFSVIGLPVVAGRGFDDSQPLDGPRAVVVNQTLAARVFAGRAIGEHIVFPFVEGQPSWEIVGVVGDEQVDQVDRAAAPIVYFDDRRAPVNDFSLAIRTTSDTSLVLSSVKNLVASLDPAVPLFAIRSMDEMVGASRAVYRRRAVLALVGVFAVAALGLAAIGMFSVIAQSVAARTRELGVRIALGAGRRRVLAAVLRQALLPAAAGLAIGLLGSVAFGAALSGLLFGVSPTDPATLAIVGGVLAVVASAAGVAPARRALRISPVDALRPD